MEKFGKIECFIGFQYEVFHPVIGDLHPQLKEVAKKLLKNVIVHHLYHKKRKKA